MKRGESRYNIRVLSRAMRLLEVLADGKSRKLAELSEAIGISQSTTFRLLATLLSYGFVEKENRSGGYRLGLTCLELARAYYDSNDLRLTALPELEKLRDATGETVHLGILDDMQVVYLEKLHGLHAIGLMTSRVGGRSPAYCTGLGKVLLAWSDHDTVQAHFSKNGLVAYTAHTITDLSDLMQHLSRVRARGYALDHGEHEPEVRCVAAPIFDISGRVVAAISASGPAGRLDPLEKNRDLIDLTVETASSISRRLGYHGQNEEK